MKKLLITGFDPFDGASVNPSFEAVRLLPDVIGDYALTKMEIPTVYGKGPQRVIDAAKKLCPDAVICVGQAGGRDAITPEVIGINLREASIPDNEGMLLSGEIIEKDAPAAYFATLPVRKMVAAIGDAGIPAKLSYSAGAFVCNDTLFSVLHHFRNVNIPVGFIHVPFLPSQAGDKHPSLPLDTIVNALIAAIKTLE